MKVNKVLLFESNPNILALMKIVFKGNSQYAVVGECQNKKTVVNLMHSESPDTLLFSHSGYIDLKMITLIDDMFPEVDIIGVRFNKDFLIQGDTSTKSIQIVSIDNEKPLNDILNNFQTIRFKEENNRSNKLLDSVKIEQLAN